MRAAEQNDVRLTERAAQWFGALKESNAERAAFFDWLAESPRHVDAFLSVLATAQDIAELTPQQRARIEQLAGEENELLPPAGIENIVPLHQNIHSPQRSSRRIWSASIAAGVLVSACAMWLVSTAVDDSYSTTIGEQREFELADGSIVSLNARTRLKVSYTEKARSIRLLEGQALFNVKQDRARPFVVASGNIEIQAVGTQFDVNKRPTETRVTVVEGSVRVSPPVATQKAHLITAGENADIAANGTIVTRASLKPAEATAWRQRRLVFREDTLGDIAAEFNRYNAALQIRVVGDAAGNQHFSGTFDADAPEMLMQALAHDETLTVERTAHEILIRERPAGISRP